MRHQQNVSALPLAVVLLVAPTNKLDDLTLLVPAVLRLLGTKLDRRVYIISE